MPKITLPIGFMILIMIITVSCGDSDLKSNETSPQSDITPQSVEDRQSIVRTPAFLDLEPESTANGNRVYVIGQTCSHYLVSYGSMPETLNDLLDGYALIWPSDIYTGKPMKILDSMPDPNNPDDIGGVYYELINYHSARIHHLYKWPSDSVDVGYEWLVGGFAVKPVMGKSMMDINSYNDPSFLTKMAPEERMWYGYQRYLQASFPFLIWDAIDRRDKVEDNILDLLNSSKYRILKSGYDKLKSGLNEGVLKFDLGSRGDTEHFYYLWYNTDYNTDDPYVPVCFEIREDGSRSDLEVPCTEFDSNNATSFFNSDDFDSYTFPDEIFIAKSDVL